MKLPPADTTVAIRYLDNGSGDRDIYLMLASVDKDGTWLSEESSNELCTYIDDEVLEWWPLTTGTGHGNNEMIPMPRTLTAENGAKALLSGEFHETIEVTCRYCGDVEDGTCPECEGNGSTTVQVTVSWPTIKDIYKMAVKHFNEEK